MADNLTVSQAPTGTLVASNEVSGVQFPRVKVCHGVAGVAVDTSTDNPIPTVQTGALPAGTNAIGKLASNDGVDIGDVTINNASLSIDDGGSTVSVDDGGGSLTVDGTVTVNDGGGSITVDGTVNVSDGGGTISIDDGGSTVSIDDGGGSLTVDGSVSISGTPNVAVTSQPALAKTTDTVSAALATDALMSGTTALTPKFAIISGSTSGDNTVIAAVTSKKIRVLSALLVSAGTTTVRFESGAGGTALTGVMSLVANTGFSLPFNPLGWFETASDTLLNMELNAAVQVSGCISYVEV